MNFEKFRRCLYGEKQIFHTQRVRPHQQLKQDFENY